MTKSCKGQTAPRPTVALWNSGAKLGRDPLPGQSRNHRRHRHGGGGAVWM